MAEVKEVCWWIINQLDQASDTVEYVSWITAAIFAVLAVFTIFLAYQFQTNTSESVKISWKIRQLINDKKAEGLKELFQDFKYFSSIPEVITSSLGVSKFIVYSLAVLWGMSGLSKIVGAVKNTNNTTFPYLSVILIGISTILFIGFSYKLVEIIKSITNEGYKELTFKNIDELKTYTKLNENGIPVENVITLDNPIWKFENLNDEPYLDVFLLRTFGFTDFAVVLTITHPNFNILLGDSISTTDEVLEINLGFQTKSSLNRIFTEEKLRLCRYQVCFYIGGIAYAYRLNIEMDDEGAPKILKFSIAEKIIWEPPIVQKKALLDGEKVEVIDRRQT